MGCGDPQAFGPSSDAALPLFMGNIQDYTASTSVKSRPTSTSTAHQSGSEEATRGRFEEALRKRSKRDLSVSSNTQTSETGTEQSDLVRPPKKPRLDVTDYHLPTSPKHNSSRSLGMIASTPPPKSNGLRSHMGVEHQRKTVNPLRLSVQKETLSSVMSSQLTGPPSKGEVPLITKEKESNQVVNSEATHGLEGNCRRKPAYTAIVDPGQDQGFPKDHVVSVLISFPCT